MEDISHYDLQNELLYDKNALGKLNPPTSKPINFFIP